MFMIQHRDKAIKIQKEIEDSFLESEQSSSCQKPPTKRRKVTAAKKKSKDEAPNAMAILAAQLQVDHFRKVTKMYCNVFLLP